MKFVSFGRCAGWFHEAPGSRGVVVVPPHGFEDLCSRHALRIAADRLAASGLPVLRFDLSGCGDSAGSDTDPDRVSTWLGEVASAAAWLRREAGVTELTLLGVRLGALLSLASLDETGATRLALVAPPLSGSALVREMAILAQVLDTPADESFEGLSVAGFRLSADTVDEIKALQPLSSGLGQLTEALMVAPDGGGRGFARLSSRLTDAGVTVRDEVFRGYTHMMADPTASTVPDAALDDVVAWIAAGAPPPRATAPQISDGSLIGESWTERGVLVGAGDDAVGMLCAPRSAQPPRQGVVFLNAGGIYHIGWAGMYVDMARRLATDGVASLRLDLPGIGDGAAWTGSGRITFYDPAGRHIRAALDMLAREGIDDVTLVGGCSGAHHAFHAAGADPRVCGLVLFNLLCFVWGPGYALPLNAWRAAKPGEVAQRQRLAADEDNASVTRRIAGLLLRRIKSPARRVFEIVKALIGTVHAVKGWLSGGNEVERAFRSLSARGTAVRLVYSEGDGGRAELERYMGRDGARAAALPGVKIVLIPDADHPLTSRRARTALEGAVRSALRRNAPRSCPEMLSATPLPA